jgi:crotonobetainyl-CoA:carnitine CoA-transferase CaiB-like acyl-CoA transferase
MSVSASSFAPLQGIKVLDFSKVLAGPLCTQYLSDLGAEIIKVEPTGHGDDTRAWPPFEGKDGTVFISANGNKQSLALDLKRPEGLEICERLAAQADVVVESFGPGVAQRLGIGFEALSKVNPRLVYCSISGFGSVGPLRDGKGFDVVLQAFSGMISLTGEADGPAVRSPFSPVDQATGLHAIIGIMGGLMERARTGKGVKVEASLFDTSVAFLSYFLQGYWQRGTEPVRAGSGHESLCPYQVFETLDKPMILGVANDGLWKSFCRVVGKPELAEREEFKTNADRVAHRKLCVQTVQDLMLSHERDEWLARLEAAGIPASPVHTLGELSEHPHTRESGMVFDYEGPQELGGKRIKGVSTPLRINGQRPAKRRHWPSLGEHSTAVLLAAGYPLEKIEQMRNQGVVR